MARAMRASGDLNPNATRVIRRILVLTDSMRPLERPCSIAARIESRCLTMRALQVDERRDPAPPRPADPAVQRFGGFVDGQLEDQPQPFLEQVGPVQARVGLGDPGQLGAAGGR